MFIDLLFNMYMNIMRLQMGHFHWFAGASSTRGSHGFHSVIFLDKASSASACRHTRRTEVRHTVFTFYKLTVNEDLRSLIIASSHL